MTSRPSTTGTQKRADTAASAVLDRYPEELAPGDLLARICRDEGIEVLDVDLWDIGGVLRHEGIGWRIYLSRQHAPHRQRLTLAHLLGHYFLHAAPGRSFVVNGCCGSCAYP